MTPSINLPPRAFFSSSREFENASDRKQKKLPKTRQKRVGGLGVEEGLHRSNNTNIPVLSFIFLSDVGLNCQCPVIAIACPVVKKFFSKHVKTLSIDKALSLDCGAILSRR